MLDDFRLRVFLTVVEEKSFTKAARRLGVTQPAVSQNISDLEKSLGVKLLKRKGQLTLSPEGEVFLMYAKGLLDQYAQLETIFTHFDSISSIGSLTVAAPLHILAEVGARLLPYVCTLCPGAKLSFVAAGSDAAEHADLFINDEGGKMGMQPSASFESNPLCELIRARLLVDRS